MHKTVCENRDFSNVIILSEDTRIFEFNQYQKSDKAPFIIYADLECIIKKIDVCKNNAENSSTTKVCKHIPSSFLMSTISLFRSIENKHDVCGGENYMKFKYTKFCEFLREHTMKIINIRKKGIRLLTKEQQESSVIFVKKNLKTKIWKIKNIVKLEIIVITQGNIEVLQIANVV